MRAGWGAGVVRVAPPRAIASDSRRDSGDSDAHATLDIAPTTVATFCCFMTTPRRFRRCVTMSAAKGMPPRITPSGPRIESDAAVFARVLGRGDSVAHAKIARARSSTASAAARQASGSTRALVRSRAGGYGDASRVTVLGHVVFPQRAPAASLRFSERGLHIEHPSAAVRRAALRQALEASQRGNRSPAVVLHQTSKHGWRNGRRSGFRFRRVTP